MSTSLIPKNSKIFPSKADKEISSYRILNRPKSDFKTYVDWFYAGHIDPVQRWIHATGMLIGLFFFAMIFIEWSPLSFLHYLLGVFFFYGSGVISHNLYDKGAGQSERKFLLTTFPTVIKINLLTLSGLYDRSLRKFIKKYPFIIEDNELIEIERSKIFSYLLSSNTSGRRVSSDTFEIK